MPDDVFGDVMKMLGKKLKDQIDKMIEDQLIYGKSPISSPYGYIASGQLPVQPLANYPTNYPRTATSSICSISYDDLDRVMLRMKNPLSVDINELEVALSRDIAIEFGNIPVSVRAYTVTRHDPFVVTIIAAVVGTEPQIETSYDISQLEIRANSRHNFALGPAHLLGRHLLDAYKEFKRILLEELHTRFDEDMEDLEDEEEGL